jgi:O-succinylbenzoic acid--CoA ligase
MSYTHTHLWANGRALAIRDIVNGKVLSNNEFETQTFSFIREWMNGQPQFILFTSGSTGSPKSITITRVQMITSAKLTAQALQLNQHHQALICLDTKYIAGKMMIVRCLVNNMKIFIVDPCANPLYKIPVDQTIHFAALVPYQVKSILASKHPHLFNNLTTVIIGGARLPDTTHALLHNYDVACYASYGMTETISHIALQRLNGISASDYFTTLVNISIRKDGRECLVIKTPYLDEEIVTNDIVEIINQNNFKWLGRWDNIINTGGFKVIPEKIESEIEKIFKSIPTVGRFFIYGMEDENFGQKVVLVLEGTSIESDLNPLKKSFTELLQSLNYYERPKAVIFVPQFIFTATGKIDRRETIKHVLSILLLS